MLKANSIAAIINNPASVNEKDKFSVDFETYFIAERIFESSANWWSVSTTKVEDSDQVGFKLNYGLSDRVALYGKLGVADWDIVIQNSFRYKYERDLYYGLGLRYISDPDMYGFFGWDIQYVTQSADVDSMRYSNETAITKSGGDGEFTEMQAAVFCGLDLAKSEKLVVATYIGLVYLDFNYEIDASSFRTVNWIVTTNNADFDNDNKLGIVTGVNVKLSDTLNVNGEIHGGFEKAFSLSFNYKF